MQSPQACPTSFVGPQAAPPFSGATATVLEAIKVLDTHFEDHEPSWQSLHEEPGAIRGPQV